MLNKIIYYFILLKFILVLSFSSNYLIFITLAFGISPTKTESPQQFYLFFMGEAGRLAQSHNQ